MHDAELHEREWEDSLDRLLEPISPSTQQTDIPVRPRADALAEGTVAVVASDDAYDLGVLSSRAHVVWSLAAGGTLEDRPRYNNTQTSAACKPFLDEAAGFPAATEAQREDDPCSGRAPRGAP